MADMGWMARSRFQSVGLASDPQDCRVYDAIRLWKSTWGLAFQGYSWVQVVEQASDNLGTTQTYTTSFQAVQGCDVLQ
jgi:hypothetical protein